MGTETRSTARVVEYPTSDGKPMAETDWHYDLLVSVRERLDAYFAADPNVYVSGNLLVFYEEGNPRRHLSPDGFVVRGVPKGKRLYYQTWAEGRFPDVVFEFTSKTTRRNDLGRKFQAYQDVWKVKEYFLFDPLAEYLKPPLQGYRLVRGKFAPLKLAGGVLTSRFLGLTLAAGGTRLMLRDAATGAVLQTPAEQQAAEERAGRERAEAEVARLRAELAALRRQPPTA